MKPLKQHPDRIISPQTEKNFYEAYAREFPFPGRGLLFVNFWTSEFRLLPVIQTEYSVPWWELETRIARVNIIRFYWLRFGVALVRPTEG